jgi:hypothetical protein
MLPYRCIPEETVTTRSVTSLEQQVGEREMPELVGAELQLKAVGGAGQWRHHHAGVVDQQGDLTVRRRGELAHGPEPGQVEFAHLGLAGALSRPTRSKRGSAPTSH